MNRDRRHEWLALGAFVVAVGIVLAALIGAVLTLS